MIYAIVFLILGCCFSVLFIVAHFLDREVLSAILFVLMIIFISLAVGFSIVEGDKFVPECRAFCYEQGYSYEQVRYEIEGSEFYCVCNKNLERHLISRTESVIIE